MKYYYTKKINKTFGEVRTRIEEDLKNYGFGIVSEINMDQKFREKLDVDFRRYTILGVCNPKHAHKAVTEEEYIGLMLPCNIIMQEKGETLTEVSVIDPIASMQAVQNTALAETAILIQEQLKEFIEQL